MTTETLKSGDLEQFIGTEHYYRHWLGFNYTDGVQYMAEKAQAHWLLDAVFSYQHEKHVKNVPFQVWHLEVTGSSAVLTMREDSDQPELVRQEIGYTDFPLDKIDLWLISGVLILPSEY